MRGVLLRRSGIKLGGGGGGGGRGGEGGGVAVGKVSNVSEERYQTADQIHGEEKNI